MANCKNFSLEEVPGAGNFLSDRRVKGWQSLWAASQGPKMESVMQPKYQGMNIPCDIGVEMF